MKCSFSRLLYPKSLEEARDGSYMIAPVSYTHLDVYKRQLIYNGVEYTVGASVIATDQSVYRGLYGKITEIRSDGDKETDNVGPDIYCAFEQPVLHDEIIALEKSFSTLYGAPRSMDDIIFDPVIMAPEMVQQLDCLLYTSRCV